MATKLKKKLGKGRHASVIKRARQNLKRRAKNKGALSKLKTAVKKVRTTKSAADLKDVVSLIARSGRKHLIHKKTASRMISRLTKTVAKA